MYIRVILFKLLDFPDNVLFYNLRVADRAGHLIPDIYVVYLIGMELYIFIASDRD
jgi:hypothetical protein